MKREWRGFRMGHAWGTWKGGQRADLTVHEGASGLGAYC